MLERGEVANSWRRERWDSLRLLTPNWQSRLPGLPYEGPDPDGYMTMGEVTGFIDGVIFMVFTGLYMWWGLREKRRWGLVALGLGSAVCWLFVIGLRWIYAA